MTQVSFYIKCARYFIQVGITIILLIFLTLQIRGIIRQYPMAVKQGHVIRLNNMIPGYKYLIEFSDKRLDFDKRAAAKYISYYQKTLRLNQSPADIYSLWAFFSYYLDGVDYARDKFELALSLNPDQFWTLYSLGVIAYEKEDFQVAAGYLNKAVNLSPQETLKYMYTSVPYRQIIAKRKMTSQQVGTRLIEGYARAYQALINVFLDTKNYVSAFHAAQAALKANVGSREVFYLYQGIALHHLKRYQDAQLLFQESLRLDPSLIDAYKYATQNSQALGQAQQAEEYLSGLNQLQNVSKSDRIFGPFDIYVF